MEKNWLIRSKKNYYAQIVGPISRAKIIELREAQVLSPDVEICSGNGFWFWIKEENLYQKYVVNQEQQPFNPISEAKSVLTLDPNAPAVAHPEVNHDITMVGGIDISELNNPVEGDGNGSSDVQLPSADELEFPDMGDINVGNVSSGVSQAEATIDEDISLGTGEHLNQQVALPPEEDLDYPEMPGVSPIVSKTIERKVAEEIDDDDDEDDEEIVVQEVKKKKKKRKKAKGRSDRRDRHKPRRNDKLFLIFAALLIIILLIIGYFYLGTDSLVEFSKKVVPTAQAQESKKKL